MLGDRLLHKKRPFGKTNVRDAAESLLLPMTNALVILNLSFRLPLSLSPSVRLDHTIPLFRVHPPCMNGKTEDTHLLGAAARTKPTPKRATLAQLAEQRLGSLQYLLSSSKSSVTSSPPSRNTARPRASTATPGRGTTSAGSEAKRASGRVRRSTSSGDVEESRTPPRDRWVQHARRSVILGANAVVVTAVAVASGRAHWGW